MKLIVVIFSAILQWSFITPVENTSAGRIPSLELNKDFPQYTPILDIQTNSNQTTEVIKHYDIIPTEGNKKQYFFIRDLSGNVVIIDSVSYDKVISYRLEGIIGSVSAIVGDTFYNILPQDGKILSTAVANLVEDPTNINWTHVGSFPSDSPSWVINGVATDGSLIYFVTYSGHVYVYDAISRLARKLFTFERMDGYGSLTVVQRVLYIFLLGDVYSFDGTSLSTIETPETRFGAGLFQMGNNVCMIGGNHTDVYPDPVHCYNPVTKGWHIASYINEARWYPGVAAIESRTYVFGGSVFSFTPNFTTFDRDSVEVLDHETNIWSYAPSPFTEGVSFIQALLFSY